MARVLGPLFSITAWGTIGDAITFSRRRGGPTVTIKPVHKITYTAEQLAQRANFAEAVSSWSALPPASKVRWIAYADGTRLSGKLMYLQNYLLGG